MQEGSLVATGSWSWGNEGVDWELYAARAIPDPAACTAAFCVALNEHHQVVLVHESRGWGLPGGHVEDSEAIDVALRRECLEEAGLTLQSPRLFAYRKIIATNPVTHPVPGKAYPFPVSYIAYYWAEIDGPLQPRTEADILAVGSYSLQAIKGLNSADYQVIEVGLKCSAKL